MPATLADSGSLPFTGEPMWIRVVGLIALAGAMAVALVAGYLRFAARRFA
jgi:hypothetical protein